MVGNLKILILILSKHKEHFITGNQSYQYTFDTTFEHFPDITAY